MSAQQLLDRLQKQGLLEQKLVARLRQQIADSDREISPQAVLKTLVGKGLLTKFQAGKLLDEIKAAAAPAAPKPPAPAVDLSPAADEPEEELGLAAFDDEPAPSDRVEELEDDESDESHLELQSLDDGGGLPPLDDGGLQPLDDGGLQALDAGDLQPISGLEPLGASGLQPLAGGGDPLTDDAFGEPAIAPPTAPGKGRKRGYSAPKKNRFQTSQWDSKLMLLGGGGLALMLVAFIVLIYSLTRGSAAEMFDKAEEEYVAGSYSQAIKLYDDFVDRYPSDPNASKARVKRGLARLRQSVGSGPRDMTSALKTAHSVLEEISSEEAFGGEARPELAALLPQIAKGFSEQAKTAEDRETALTAVGKAEDAMELVNNPENVPSSYRPGIEATLETIEDNLKDAKRSIQQSERLAEAVTSIAEAAAPRDTAKAYEIRKQLLIDYPGLEGNAQLIEALRQTTQAEQSLVQVQETPVSPSSEERQTPTSLIVLVHRTEENPTQGLENRVALVLASGSVYGLDAATGKVKWRRFVGYETTFTPLPLPGQGGGDALIADARTHELLRVSADSGALKWRLGLGESFADPVAAHGKIYVAAHSGRLWEIDPETGLSPRQVKFPMRLTVAPTFDAKRPKLYQPGEHSNLYVLSLGTLQCEQVHYVGHKPGSVNAPGAISAGYLFLAENSGGSTAMLHVIRLDGKGLNLTEVGNPKRLTGHVAVAPVLYGRRVLVVTDLGAVHVYDVEPSDTKRPVNEAVQPLVDTFDRPVVGYPLADAGNVWIAGQRLTMYEIQFAQDKLVRKWIKYDNDEFVGPLQLIGDSLISVRKRQDSAGVSVMATDVRQGEMQWQTDLAVPTVLVTPSQDGAELTSVTSNASLFKLGKQQLAAGFQDERLAPVATRAGFLLTNAVPFGDQRWALSSDSGEDRLLIYAPNERSVLRVFPLASGAANAKTTCRPVSFLGGLLVPMDSGQVLLISPGAAGQVLPFQPRVEAGVKVAWRRPAVIGGGQFVITDGQKMYRVEVKKTPKPHLSQAAVVDLKDNISSPLAAVGNSVFGVVSQAGGDAVVSFEAPAMAVKQRWALKGRVTWGPEQVGEMILVTTDDEGLICFAAGNQQKWISPLKHGPLAGTPLMVEQGLLLTSKSGVIWKLDAETGAELATRDLGEPLGAGAIEVNSKIFFPEQEEDQRLLLPGSDGVLHVINKLQAGS